MLETSITNMTVLCCTLWLVAEPDKGWSDVCTYCLDAANKVEIVYFTKVYVERYNRGLQLTQRQPLR